MLKFVLVVVLIGALVYLTVRVIERRGVKPTPRPQPPRPKGPDDDPDFLWDLDRKKRHRDPKPDSTPQPKPDVVPEDPEGPTEDS